MNLEKELLKSQALVQCNRIIKYIGDKELRFAELMKLFFKGEYRLTQHAAWPMSYCIRKHPILAKPYFKKFIDQLSDSNAHPAARRNIVRLLQFVEIPKRFHGKLMDICFQFINNPEEAVAVKAFSFSILSNLAEIYPEILPEIKTVIEARWEFETPAFRSRARKILNQV
ncbi:MAG TPA: hypothetical protein VNW49_10720 [Puia sp.]|nr:hypothetical protein [Puia sp.]